GQILGRNSNIHAEVQRGAKLRLLFFSLLGRYGALQHLGVEIESDRGDVAVLLTAQQISRAAQFQIKGRDAKAGAKLAKFAQRGKSAPRYRSERGFRRDQQVRIGALVGTPHAPAELIKLG